MREESICLLCYSFLNEILSHLPISPQQHLIPISKPNSHVCFSHAPPALISLECAGWLYLAWWQQMLLPESDGWSRCWVPLLFQIGGYIEKDMLSWSLLIFLGCKAYPSVQAHTKSISKTVRGVDFFKLTHRLLEPPLCHVFQEDLIWISISVGGDKEVPG